MSVTEHVAVGALVCPETRLQLHSLAVEEAEERAGRSLVARRNTPFGRTERVLLRSDAACAYPVLEQGIPVLLLPEMLLPEGSEREWDLSAPQYAEAYAEMAHYDAVGDANRRAAEAKGLHELERSSDSLRSLAAIAELVEEDDWRFRHPLACGWTRRMTGLRSATPIGTSLHSPERLCSSWVEPAPQRSSSF